MSDIMQQDEFATAWQATFGEPVQSYQLTGFAILRFSVDGESYSTAVAAGEMARPHTLIARLKAIVDEQKCKATA